MTAFDAYRQYLDERDAEIQRELKAAYAGLSDEIKKLLAKHQPEAHELASEA
jgi:hypothetical protein